MPPAEPFVHATSPQVGPARVADARLPVEYVLPLRSSGVAGLAELTVYLRRLARWVDVTVVDGSPEEIFAAHGEAWRGLVRHLRPDDDLRYANGKVNGVTTGVRHARHESVVIADDDVRYDLAGLYAVHDALRGAELARPQNYFAPMVWHARWDTARSLLNRGLGGDYPGTLGVRRSAFLHLGGYDGDVLFENLELIRTVRAGACREARLDGVYVRRLPPEPGRFFDQRLRQAYDDLAQPVRLAAVLAVAPVCAAAVVTGRRWVPAALAVAAVSLAERGRRRAGGASVFPASASLLAPVWVAERAVCGWVAVGLRLSVGGVRYAGRRIRTAAHPVRQIRERLHDTVSYSQTTCDIALRSIHAPRIRPGERSSPEIHA